MELIAKTLLENETITAEEISYLLEHRSLEGMVKKIEPPTPAIEEASKEKLKTIKKLLKKTNSNSYSFID